MDLGSLGCSGYSLARGALGGAAVKKRSLLLSLVGVALALPACQQQFRQRLEQYPPELMHALNAAEAVLARHFVVTHVDKVHGVVEALSLTRANMYTKYRTRAVARIFRTVGRVYPPDERAYGVQVRVTNELEVSEPSLLGGSQPGYDWRAVGFDHVLEAALMAEVEAQLQGQKVTVPPRSTWVMFLRPTSGPLRHSDLFRPRIPDVPGGPKKEAPKAPNPSAPAPKPQCSAAAAPRTSQLFDEYIRRGDLYLRRGEHDKALLEYQRAALARPGSASAHLSLASVWTTLGRYPAGAAHLRQAARSEEQRLTAQQLRRLRSLSHDVNERLLLLKGWCRKNPRDNDARLLLGYHCLLAERAAEAHATLQEVLKGSPKDPAAQYLIRQLEALSS